jgi:hypothetical protein
MQSIREGAAIVTWQAGTFAYAESYNERPGGMRRRARQMTNFTR